MSNVPWVEKYRPHLLADVEGNVETVKRLRAIASDGNLPNIILSGPPGCGKTMLAKAVATECRANFISVALPDILTRWVGESEGNVREIFQQARSVRPCVLFVDEIDAVASSRTGGAELSDAGACNGVVSALLSELDANSSMDGVVVIGACGAPPFSCPFRFLASDSVPLPVQDQSA